MVIDLSVSNLEGNYMDKSSTNKMLYMAFTIAKEYQPSIIFMDDIDLVFPAKKPKRGAG
jgi:ATP-dependent 26S proteasome regulatory subunit